MTPSTQSGRSPARRAPSLLVSLAALVVLVAGLRTAEAVLVPLIFSTFLAVLTAPAVIWLSRRHVPDAIGVPLVVLGVLLLLSSFGAIVGGSINRFVNELPLYQDRLRETLGSTFEWAKDYGVSTERLRALINPGALLELVGRTMSSVASSLSDALLIVLTVAFMLLEVTGMRRKLRRALGDPAADLSQLERMVVEVKSYVVVKTYVSAGTGVAIGIFTAAMGLDFAILWGLLAFLLNYVPNIGSVIAAVPPVLLAVVRLGWSGAGITLLGFLAANFLIGSVVEPRLMGKKLGLSTLVVWVSLIFWGWLWGPIGMLLSVPLTMVVKIGLEHSPTLRAVAIMMDAPRSS